MEIWILYHNPILKCSVWLMDFSLQGLETYPMTAAKRGVCVILNNHDFSKSDIFLKDRVGTNVDERKLSFCSFLTSQMKSGVSFWTPLCVAEVFVCLCSFQNLWRKCLDGSTLRCRYTETLTRKRCCLCLRCSAKETTVRWTAWCAAFWATGRKGLCTEWTAALLESKSWWTPLMDWAVCR